MKFRNRDDKELFSMACGEQSPACLKATIQPVRNPAASHRRARLKPGTKQCLAPALPYPRLREASFAYTQLRILYYFLKNYDCPLYQPSHISTFPQVFMELYMERRGVLGVA